MAEDKEKQVDYMNELIKSLRKYLADGRMKDESRLTITLGKFFLDLPEHISDKERAFPFLTPKFKKFLASYKFNEDCTFEVVGSCSLTEDQQEEYKRSMMILVTCFVYDRKGHRIYSGLPLVDSDEEYDELLCEKMTQEMLWKRRQFAMEENEEFVASMIDDLKLVLDKFEWNRKVTKLYFIGMFIENLIEPDSYPPLLDFKLTPEFAECLECFEYFPDSSFIVNEVMYLTEEEKVDFKREMCALLLRYVYIHAEQEGVECIEIDESMLKTSLAEGGTGEPSLYEKIRELHRRKRDPEAIAEDHRFVTALMNDLSMITRKLIWCGENKSAFIVQKFLSAMTYSTTDFLPVGVNFQLQSDFRKCLNSIVFGENGLYCLIKPCMLSDDQRKQIRERLRFLFKRFMFFEIEKKGKGIKHSRGEEVIEWLIERGRKSRERLLRALFHTNPPPARNVVNEDSVVNEVLRKEEKKESIIKTSSPFTTSEQTTLERVAIKQQVMTVDVDEQTEFMNELIKNLRDLMITGEWDEESRQTITLGQFFLGLPENMNGLEERVRPAPFISPEFKKHVASYCFKKDCTFKVIDSSPMTEDEKREYRSLTRTLLLDFMYNGNGHRIYSGLPLTKPGDDEETTPTHLDKIVQKPIWKRMEFDLKEDEEFLVSMIDDLKLVLDRFEWNRNVTKLSFIGMFIENMSDPDSYPPLFDCELSAEFTECLKCFDYYPDGSLKVNEVIHLTEEKKVEFKEEMCDLLLRYVYDHAEKEGIDCIMYLENDAYVIVSNHPKDHIRSEVKQENEEENQKIVRESSSVEQVEELTSSQTDRVDSNVTELNKDLPNFALSTFSDSDDLYECLDIF